MYDVTEVQQCKASLCIKATTTMPTLNCASHYILASLLTV